MRPDYKKPAAMLFAYWLVLVALNVMILPGRYSPHARIETLRSSPLLLGVRASGEIQPKKSVTLKAEFDGPVRAKSYRDGDNVKQGQRLYQIGRDRLQADYDARLNAFKNAQADLAKAKRDLQTQKKLFHLQAVARSAVEEANNSITRSEQALQMASATYHAEMDLWNHDVVVAPFSGTIIKDSLGQDPAVSAGKEILTLADVSEYSVRVRVDELQVGGLRAGQNAIVRVQAFPQTALEAQVTLVGAQSDAGQVPVVLTLKSAGGLKLLPQMSAEAIITTGQTDATLSVPLTSLAVGGREPEVWTLNSMGRLKLRRILAGQSSPERVEVRRGLSEGDRICAKADPAWVEGMKVLIDE